MEVDRDLELTFSPAGYVSMDVYCRLLCICDKYQIPVPYLIYLFNFVHCRLFMEEDNT